MSRIHEALKKAELEAGAALADLGPIERQTNAASHQEDLTSLAEKKTGIASPTVDFSKGSAALRLEEINKKCRQVRWQSNPATNVFASRGLNAEAAEQFRTLRSRLYHLRDEASLRSIVITSPLAGDGKTFVASNLAHAIVRQPDRRVLLIDADLRCSNLHRALGADSEPGLREYLSGEAEEMSVIQHGQEGGLYFIPGGKAAPNASELLSNGRLKALLERSASCFDWIIIDSPPCLPVADPRVIAGLCDGTLLVIRAGSTPSSAAERATQELHSTRFLGVVLNGVDERTLVYGSYYGRNPYVDGKSDDSTQ